MLQVLTKSMPLTKFVVTIWLPKPRKMVETPPTAITCTNSSFLLLILVTSITPVGIADPEVGARVAKSQRRTHRLEVDTKAVEH